MKNINNKFIHIFIIALFVMNINPFIRKGTSSIQEYSTNRSKLQDLVVSTALSYYYNNNYTDYEQKSMDYYYNENNEIQHNSTFMWRNFNNTPEDVSRSNFCNFDCSSFVSSVYLYSLGFDYSDYRELNPFSFINGENFTSYNTAKSIGNYQNAYLLLGKGQGTSITQYEISLNNYKSDHFNTDSSSEFVYYYEVKGLKNDNTYNESVSTQNTIKNTIINNLQPGDILHYRRHRLTDGKTSGHVLIYVGDLFGNGKHGFIHSTGNDFNVNSSGVVTALGDDKYTVKYDTWEDAIKSYIFIDNTWRSTSFAIIRPINKYCTSDSNCVINSSNVRSLKYKNDISTYLENAIARDELSNMRIEQFQFLDGTVSDVLNKYNSVNIGDTITYRLVLTNKNSFKYCSNGKYDNQADCEKPFEYTWDENNNICTYNDFNNNAGIVTATLLKNKNDCESYNAYHNGYCTVKTASGGTYGRPQSCIITGNGEWINNTWNTTNRTTVDYNNIQVTAKIPEGSEYVDGSCYFRIHTTPNTTNNSCSYDANTRTITWDKIDISATQNAARSFNYKVTPVEGNEIVNDGMSITTNSGNTLQMGKMSVLVNSTINDTNKINRLQEIIDERINSNVQYGANSGIKFIRDVYSKYLYDEYLYKYNSSNNSWENDSSLNYLDEFSSYATIRNAIFVDRKENKLEEKAQYHRRVNYSTLSPKQKTINTMLVPGEYGGKWLRYNINSDRAKILFKYGYKTTLEVGDIIIAFNNSDTTYRNFASQYVWIFYGYDEDNQPIFIRCYRDNDTGSKYVINNNDSSVTGYEIYKKIYAYDLFMVLRPTRAYSNSYKYNINYAMNGAIASSELPTEASITDTINIPNPTKNITWHFNANNTGIELDFTEATGQQVFTGWSVSNDTEISYNAKAGNNTTSLSTWNGALTTNTYFSGLGFENDTIKLTANWMSNQTIQMPIIEKDGYTCFWSGNASGTSNTQANSGENRTPSTKASANYTWYAHCDPSDYIIAFNPNNGNGEMNNYNATFNSEFSLPINTFTRNGYTFTGWNTEPDGSGTDYDDEENVTNLISTGMITLYAQWEANKYTIKFNNNSGTGNMNDIIFEYDEEKALTTNAFAKTGYSFGGWNTNTNGTGNSYNNDEIIKNLTSTNNDIITLYAQWIPDEYTIIFDGNGGILEAEDDDIDDEEITNTETTFIITATYDESFNIPNNKFIKRNANFTGWNTESDGSGTNYSPETEVTNITTSNNITLYAQWEKTSLIQEVTDDLLLDKQNHLVGNVANDTSFETLISKLTVVGTVEILDNNKNTITGRNTVQGGDYIRVTDGDDVTDYTIIISGDVNKDFIVNIQDIIILAKYIIDKQSEFDYNDLLLGDINHDGLIKMNDVILILCQ